MKSVAEGGGGRRKYFLAAPQDLHPSPSCGGPPGSEDAGCVQHLLIAARYKTVKKTCMSCIEIKLCQMEHVLV